MKYTSIADELEDVRKRVDDMRSVFLFFEDLHTDHMLRVKLISRLVILEVVLEEMEAEVGRRLPDAGPPDLPF